MQQYTTDMERVATLIDSYREEIGGINSKNVKALRDFVDSEEKKIQKSVAKRVENGEDVFSFFTDIQIPIELENKTKANEQLLGHFYSKVAGNEADKNVLLQLLGDYYDETFFSSEEESFLLAHYTELINYIINTSYIAFQEYDDLKDAHLIPSELLKLIAKRIEIPNDATIYNPFAGFAQFTKVYNHHNFICEESYSLGSERSINDSVNWLWAWMKVAIYANNAHVEVVETDEIPSSYDYVLSYIPFTFRDFFLSPNNDTLKCVHSRVCEATLLSKIELAYHNLSKDGKMVLLLPDYLFRNNGDSYPLGEFWKQMIKNGAFIEIIQLPSTCNGLNYNFCLIVIDKKGKSNYVTMIDARFAAKKNTESKIIELDDYLDVIRENKRKSESMTSPGYYKGVFIEGEEKMVEEFDTPFFQTIDLDLFDAMLHNNGILPATGLRKMVSINKKVLKPNILLPQAYVIEKPTSMDNFIPLSSLCSYCSSTIRDLAIDLPMDTPWIKDKNLSYTFQGPLNLIKVEKADCPNNPPHTNDYSFNSNGELSEEHPWYQPKPIGRRVLEYRKSTFLNGSKGAVLIKYDSKGNPFTVLATESKPIAVAKDIMVFCPNEEVQLNTLAAVLKMPIVYNQIIAYKGLDLSKNLDEILVPYNKWLIDNEVSRLINEEKTYISMMKNSENMKKSVRMRKHALTQSMSSIQAMFNALNAYRVRKDGKITDDEIISRVKGTTVNEAFEYLSSNIKGIMSVLEHIADVEYSFGYPEWIDPESFIADYISKNEKGWISFKPIITWEEGENKAKDNIIDPSTGIILFRKGEAFCQFMFPKAALEKILDNIVSNAQSHGFDKSRNNYHLKFSWYAENKAIKLLVENNGSPIPDDRDPASLLEYGVSTALHSDGHNGIGCNEIDDIMQRYDGKVEIISSPHEEYTVKYLLTFNHSNSIN